MIIDSTIHETRYTKWCIRIAPAPKSRDMITQAEAEETLFRSWTPQKGSTWVFYNPKITLYGQQRNNKDSRVTIPITMIPLFKTMLHDMIVTLDKYKNHIFRRVGEEQELYIDHAKAKQYTKKLTIPRGNTITAMPAVGEYDDELSPVVQFQRETSYSPFYMSIPELYDLYDRLAHLDLTTYTAMLGMLEKIDQVDKKCAEMNRKLDILVESQRNLIRLLDKGNLERQYEDNSFLNDIMPR